MVGILVSFKCVFLFGLNLFEGRFGVRLRSFLGGRWFGCVVVVGSVRF